MISMKDIAAVCGVSVATVSKALNGHRDVSEATRERVNTAAQELGYAADSAAQKERRARRTYNIGLLYPNTPDSACRLQYYSAILDSFRRSVEDLGYDLTFINRTMPRKAPMSCLAHARFRGIEGVCAVREEIRSPEMAELLGGDIPLITVDSVADGRSSLESDQVTGMRQLLTHAAGLGHRKIAFLYGRPCAVTNARLSSFRQTAGHLGLSLPAEYLREADYGNPLAAFEQTQALLDLPDPPTCIFFPDDDAVPGGLNAVLSRGLSVPKDISIAGFGGFPLSRQLRPRLTTICQDTDAIGSRAARLLISHIEYPDTTPVQHLLLPVRLQDGESIARVAPDRL